MSLVLLTAVALCTVWRLLPRSSVSDDLVASKSQRDDPTSAPVASTDRHADQRVEPGQDTVGSSTRVPAEQREVPFDNAGVTDESPGESVAAISSNDLASTSATPDRTFPAFEDLRQRNFRLELPGRGSELELTETKLAAIPLATGERLQLSLVGGADSTINLVRGSDKTPDVQAWNIVKRAQLGFGAQEDVLLGQFIHREGELRFQWDASVPLSAKPGSLQFMPLEIRIGTNRQICHLWKPATVNSIRFSAKGTNSVEVPLPGSLIDRMDLFRVEYQLIESENSKRRSATVAMGETAKLPLGDDGELELEFKFKFAAGEGRSSMQVRLFGTPSKIKGGTLSREPRQEISTTLVEELLIQAKAKDPKKKSAEIAKLQAQRAKADKVLTQKKSASDDGDFSPLEKQIELLDVKISKLEADFETMQSLFEATVEWCQKAGRILRDLEDRSQLCYAIYRETEPRMVIIETSGFRWTKE